MTVAIEVFNEIPQITQTIVWGETQVRVRLTFRERVGSWYVDIFEQDGTTPIILGRRVSPRWAPVEAYGLADRLSRTVVFVVDGPTGSDPYDRTEVQTDGPVRLLLVDLDEFPPDLVTPALTVELQT